MTAFLRNAQEIFEVARQSDEPEDITIHLESTSYRIQRAQGKVSVEGRSGGLSCLVQTAQAYRTITRDRPMYLLAS